VEDPYWASRRNSLYNYQVEITFVVISNEKLFAVVASDF
jgi:hypothetical protein